MDVATMRRRSVRVPDAEAANGAPALAAVSAGSDVPQIEARSDITALHVGLRFKKEVPYEVWSALGTKLAPRKNSACWWLGDWIVFGERNYLRYRDAIDTTGLDYQTLRNYASVARRFPLSRRRDTLSFQHHAAVSALPDEEQDRWLDLAAAGGWSLHVLRNRLRDAKAECQGPAHVVRFHIDSDRERRWRDRASERGVSFRDWIVETLDAAATEIAL